MKAAVERMKDRPDKMRAMEKTILAAYEEEHLMNADFGAFQESGRRWDLALQLAALCNGRGCLRRTLRASFAPLTVNQPSTYHGTVANRTLAFFVTKDHPFTGGNKRIGAVATSRNTYHAMDC